MVDLILFPASFFRITKVDEDLQQEYDAVIATGLFDVCIKEFLDLKHYGDKTNEYRVFYINHEIATICRNSGQGNYTPEPPRELIGKYARLDSPYYTVDYAELEDGTWRIVEAGDGEVSGLSEGQNYEHYFRALHHCFMQRPGETHTVECGSENANPADEDME